MTLFKHPTQRKAHAFIRTTLGATMLAALLSGVSIAPCAAQPAASATVADGRQSPVWRGAEQQQGQHQQGHQQQGQGTQQAAHHRGTGAGATLESPCRDGSPGTVGSAAFT